MVGTFLRHKITWKQEDCKRYNQEHIFYVNAKNIIRKKDLPFSTHEVYCVHYNFCWALALLLHSIANSSLFPTSMYLLWHF